MPEIRTLDAIRASLKNPNAEGPAELYAIVMDVGKPKHKAAMVERNLLFGVVTYAAGQVGDEPVRSQGHIHVRNPRNGWSTPEVYEIWQGKAVILMQEKCEVDGDDPGRCFAVEAGPGQVVIVPPNWAHATISADPKQPLTFGAWCDRNYGFEYEGVRAHGGLAWFPLVEADGTLRWEANPTYAQRELVRKEPESYVDLGLQSDTAIYRQFEVDPDRFLFVPDPSRVATQWNNFTP